MPTPILKIPVDDQDFKKFLELFNKYKGELASLPELWKDTSDEIVAQISAANEVVNAIDKQTTLLLMEQRTLAAETREYERQAKLKEKQEKSEDKARQEQARANKKAVEDTKKITSNITQATVNIMKWGAIDFIAAGALDLWGVGTLSKNVGSQFGSSLGVGTTIGQRNAFIQTFQPFFDATSALEHAAEAQTDITKSIPYRILGLNPNGMDPAELATQTILAVRRKLSQYPKQLQLTVANALGFNQIMGGDELRTAVNAPAGLLEREQTRYEANKKLLDITPDVAEKFTILSQDLNLAGQAIEAHFVNKLVSLTPGLDSATKTFVDVVNHLIDLIPWDSLEKDLIGFSDYIAKAVRDTDWNQVGKDLHAFGQGLTWLAEQVPWDKVKTDLIEFGVILDKTITFIMGHLPNKVQRDILSAAASAATTVVTNGIVPFNPSPLLGDVADNLGIGSDSGLHGPELSRAQQLYKDLRAQGLSNNLAIGGVAYSSLESDLTPGIPGDRGMGGAPPGVPSSYGMFQLHGTFKNGKLIGGELYNFVKEFGHLPSASNPNDYKEEVKYFAEEILRRDPIFGKYRGQAEHDPGSAGYYIRKYFGRGSDPEGQGRQGARRARALAQQLKLNVTVGNHDPYSSGVGSTASKVAVVAGR